ncbi:MAG: Ppx/GppA family phosphatase [Sandaracinaceae bacterium]|nr:Ppx/GppA family phosphatase [Sandaracinaceae bacterium]
MPRFASIDVGSNASRLRIVEALGPDDVREIKSLRIPVRLGHGVFLTGKLDHSSVEKCVEAMRRFADEMEDAEVERYRAVVTASAREASNSRELLARVRREAGITLDSIDGSEEARLVRLAVTRSVNLKGKRALLMDLGGGSLELTDIDRTQPLFSTSVEIGTVRLLEAFLTPGKPVKGDQEKLLLEYLERMLGPVMPHLARKRYGLVVGTGGNFDAIAQLAPGALPKTIDVRRARNLLTKLVHMNPQKRAALYGLRSDRADVIVPALYVLMQMATTVRAKTVVAPGVGLKEGILFELIDKHFSVWDYRTEDDAAAGAAVQLGRRYHFDEAHAAQVTRLATTLFDRLQVLHKLNRQDRHLLRIAALLHDIGDFIHFASHHKHSQYIIEHSEIMGLSSVQRVMVGCIARYHRRAIPTAEHTSYKRLDPVQRTRVRKLAAILRLADAFDREHLRKVRDFDVRVLKDKVVLRVRGAGDIALELWTVARKANLFEAAFRRRLEIEVVSNGAKAKSRTKSKAKSKARSKPKSKLKRKRAAKKATRSRKK